MKIKRIILTGTLALCGTLATLLPSQVQAQTNADITNHAFAVTVPININNFTFTPVAIPAGKRLVIQNVSLSGAAETTGAYVVPIIILAATLGSESQNLYYYAPTPYPTDPSQYYLSQPTTVYADTLYASPAFAGFTPSFMSFNVVITGYLVDAPKATTPPS